MKVDAFTAGELNIYSITVVTVATLASMTTKWRDDIEKSTK